MTTVSVTGLAMFRTLAPRLREWIISRRHRCCQFLHVLLRVPGSHDQHFRLCRYF